MKKLIFLLLLLLIATPCFAQQQEARMSLGVMGGGVPTGAPPAGPTQVATDDFSGTLDNWTQVAGSWIISDGYLKTGYGSGTGAPIIYHETAVGSNNQYVKVNLLAFPGGSEPCVLLRYTSASSTYLVCFGAAYTDFYGPDYDSKIKSTSGAWVSTDTACLTIVGNDAGNSTYIRVWEGCTGDIPTSESNWGGDTSPNAYFSEAGDGWGSGSAVDTGAYTGLGGYVISGGNDMNFDNFFMGRLD